MEKRIITKRIENLRRGNEKITQTLIAMDGTDLEQHADNFKYLAIDAALRSELITCRMRHLLYDYTDIRKPEYLTSAAVVQGIIIREYSDMFESELPCLFPHRKQRQSSEYYSKPIPAYRKGYLLFSASHLPEKVTVFGIGQRTQDIFNAETLSTILGKTVITRTFEEVAGNDIKRIHHVSNYLEINRENRWNSYKKF